MPWPILTLPAQQQAEQILHVAVSPHRQARTFTELEMGGQWCAIAPVLPSTIRMNKSCAANGHLTTATCNGNSQSRSATWPRRRC